MPPRLQEQYRQDVVGALRDRFGYSNVMQVPSVEKVVLNMGVGGAVQNPKSIEGAVEDLTIIAGQKPTVRRAK